MSKVNITDFNNQWNQEVLAIADAYRDSSYEGFLKRRSLRHPAYPDNKDTEKISQSGSHEGVKVHEK